MDKEEIEKLYNFSVHNEKDLENSLVAHCFSCLQTYSVDQIDEFIEEKNGTQTAICPICYVDAVIAGNKNVSDQQLLELNRTYFRMEN